MTSTRKPRAAGWQLALLSADAHAQATVHICGAWLFGAPKKGSAGRLNTARPLVRYCAVFTLRSGVTKHLPSSATEMLKRPPSGRLRS